MSFLRFARLFSSISSLFLFLSLCVPTDMRDKIIAIAINKQPSGKCAFKDIMCKKWRGMRRLQEWSTWYEKIDKFNISIGNGIDTQSSRIHQHKYTKHGGGGDDGNNGEYDGDGGGGGDCDDSSNSSTNTLNTNNNSNSNYYTGDSNKSIRWYQTANEYE